MLPERDWNILNQMAQVVNLFFTYGWFKNTSGNLFSILYILAFSSIGLYIQHSAKKPKIFKQQLENTFDNMTTMTGSIPSPVASQNNMSNAHKFIKLIGGRDRGRKAKSLKVLLSIALIHSILRTYVAESLFFPFLFF